MTRGQQQAMDRLLPVFGLNIADFADGPRDIQNTLGGADSVVVEIGFGDGEALVQMARENPQSGFVGIEVHPPGVGHLLLRLGELEIDNVRVFTEDAVDVIRSCIADETVDKFCLFFPDPWPKKKHNKRRILNAEFAELLTRKLKPGGRFHFATDWEEYAWQALECLGNMNGLVNTAGSGQFSPRPEDRPLTKFERRGQRLGHSVFDIVMQKSSHRI